MKIKNRIFAMILAISALLSAVGILSSCSGTSHTVNEILSAELSGDNTVKIKVGLSEDYLSSHKREKVYLLAMDSAGNAGSIVGEAKVKANLTFKVKLSSIYAGYALAEYVSATAEKAEHYNTITETYYISNPWKLAQTSVSERYPSQYKGLALNDTDDLGEAAYLGVGSTLFDVRIDKLLLSDNSEGAYAHIYNGKTYFYHKEYLDELDAKIKGAAALGMRVYLRFILGLPEKDEDGEYTYEPIDILYCSDASSNAAGYLPDMGNVSSVGYIGAMFDFIASRYSSYENGIVSDYIIGKNLNLRERYNNAGSISSDRYNTYCNYYARLAYTTLSSHISGGKVYLSISPIWSGSESGGKAFLNSFLSYSRRGGDFDWGVAATLEAEIEGSDSIWEDTNVANPYLTINSMYELSDLLATKSYLHDGKPRSAIISDFKLTTTTKNDSDKQRAASYLYAYYKLLEDDAFDSFFYSEFEKDGYGLKSADGSTGALYSIFRDCGGNVTSELSAYSGIIGNKWSLLPPDILAKGVSTSYFTADSTTVEAKKLKKPLALYDFTSGSLHDFGVSGGIYSCALEAVMDDGNGEAISTTILSTKLNGEHGWSALIRRGIKLSDLSSAKYMAIDISSLSGSENAMLLLKQRNAEGDIVFCKDFTISGNDEIYYFDISGFVKNADKKNDIELYLYFIPEDTEDGAEIQLRSINLYGATNASSVVIGIVIAIVTIIALATIGIVAFNIIKRKKDEEETDEE